MMTPAPFWSREREADRFPPWRRRRRRRSARRRQRDRRPAPEDFARRAGINAGQEFDERRLAGAILTDDRVNFALLEGHIDGYEGVSRAETLVQLV